MTTDLHVPSAAKHAYVRAVTQGGDIIANVRAIAAPVLAAYLERLAARGVPTTPWELRERAAALRGEAS